MNFVDFLMIIVVINWNIQRTPGVQSLHRQEIHNKNQSDTLCPLYLEKKQNKAFPVNTYEVVNNVFIRVSRGALLCS